MSLAWPLCIYVCCRNFISGFAPRMNQLSLAKMAVTVSREFSSPEDAANFLQEVRFVTSLHLHNAENHAWLPHHDRSSCWL